MGLSGAIIVYGTGSIPSLEMALRAAGAVPVLVPQHADLASADAVILPGVGHFAPASTEL